MYKGKRVDIMLDRETGRTLFPNCLEAVWKRIGLFALLKAANGPLSFRETLGVSQSTLGRWLAVYAGRDLPYQRGTLSVWERVEVGVRQPTKYVMSAGARALYEQLVKAVVELLGGNRYHLIKQMGPRRWRFELEAKCANCGKPFKLRRADQVRCRRCIAKGKR